MRRSSRRARVAVFGGGCAALTTAFELTRPEHRGRFEVTLYQMGFRLGGKGASSRGADDRILEHGLHLWLGFYENAFRLMREVYAEARRDRETCPIATFADAFSPAPVVAVTDRAPNGDFAHWVATFPPGEGMPGDPLSPQNPFTVRGYLVKAASMLVELLRSAAGKSAAAPAEGRARGPEDIVAAVERALRYAELATAAAILEAVELLRAALETLSPPVYSSGNRGVLLRLIEAISAAARRQLEMLTGGDREMLRVFEVVDIILAILRGSIRFGLAVDPRGFDAIDDYEWRDWLEQNGASRRSLDSGFVRGIYDLAFAFEEGDVRRPALSASVALRGAMRMFFTYRGALFFRMHAGMGDVVFAPLYEVLKRRGVRFAFFHRLENIKLAPASSLAPGEHAYVAAIELSVQAEIEGGGEYQPLVDVRGLPCWPDQPSFDQLVDGARMREERWAFESPWEERVAGTRTLHVGRDFDFVVLGLGVGAAALTCRELIEREPRWRRMVEHVKTVPTQAFQLWLDAGARELGWGGEPVNLSGFEAAFATWADMTHLVPAESWRVAPRHIAYFCSVLPVPSGPPGEALVERARAEVRETAVRFLERDVATLWPLALDRGGFRWDLCCAGDRAGPVPEGRARFDTQFWTANVRPSDRYTLALPGSSKHRISPLDMTFDNLTVAGDWTLSGLNSGCIESAVMSGLLAAHALSGSPSLEDIIGYDHP